MPKILQGQVMSTKMQKTVIVEVTRLYQHPLYKKIVKKHKKYQAHNDNLPLKQGDVVVIQETRPRSKEKRFMVVKKINQ